MSRRVKSVREQAMDYLARREHSQFELAQKLARKGFADDVIAAAIDQLTNDGLQSDQRFTESYVRYRANAGFGPLRILAELRQRGVGERLAEACVFDDSHDWRQRLLDAQLKKFGDQSNPVAFDDRARQLRFLQQRGFAAVEIQRLYK